MRSRYLQSLVVLAVLLNGHSSASDASVEMVPVRDGVSFQDLSNLAHLLGVRFTVFDYETVEPHCLHFYVDETSVYGESTKHDGPRNLRS